MTFDIFCRSAMVRVHCTRSKWSGLYILHWICMRRKRWRTGETIRLHVSWLCGCIRWKIEIGKADGCVGSEPHSYTHLRFVNSTQSREWFVCRQRQRFFFRKLKMFQLRLTAIYVNRFFSARANASTSCLCAPIKQIIIERKRDGKSFINFCLIEIYQYVDL